MHIVIEGWDPVDRKAVRGELRSVDRAQTQAADLVTVVLAAGADDGGGSNNSNGNGSSSGNSGSGSGRSVVIKQNPTMLQRDRPGGVRVGAAVWDSGYVLSALLERRAAAGALRLQGAKVVELGAGCGLAGLVAARLGAAVMLTDRADVLVHARGNAAKNKLLWAPPVAAAAAPTAAAAAGSSKDQQPTGESAAPPPPPPPPGRAGVMPLDWSAPDASSAAASVLAAMGGHVDVVLASDSIYPDPSGCETNARGFVEACAALCSSPATRVLVTYEPRLPEVRAALVGAARARFGAAFRALSAADLAEGWAPAHIEAFEMRLPAPAPPPDG